MERTFFPFNSIMTAARFAERKGLWRSMKAMSKSFYRLRTKNNEKVAACAINTISTAFYDLRTKIAELQ